MRNLPTNDHGIGATRRSARFEPYLWKAILAAGLIAVVVAPAARLSAREKDTMPYGEGLIVNVPFPENEVAQVVQDVVQNGIIRGTKEYNKDEFISGAMPQSSVKVFPAWTQGGQVFYKVRTHALDPRNFKNGGDVGTLAVRYVIQAQGEKNTVLRINAIFVEEFRRISHLSNGSVESAEYKDIHDRLDEIGVMKTQTAEALREKEEARSAPGQVVSSSSSVPASPVPAPTTPAETSPVNTTPENHDTLTYDTSSQGNGPPQTLEERAQDLRSRVERRVKGSGGALRSAPFHTASTLQSLAAGTEVLIVIETPYWLGIETHEGQHGWMLRDDLELLP